MPKERKKTKIGHRIPTGAGTAAVRICLREEKGSEKGIESMQKLGIQAHKYALFQEKILNRAYPATIGLKGTPQPEKPSPARGAPSAFSSQHYQHSAHHFL